MKWSYFTESVCVQEGFLEERLEDIHNCQKYERKFAFLSFQTPAEATACVELVHGTEFEDKKGFVLTQLPKRIFRMS